MSEPIGKKIGELHPAGQELQNQGERMDIILAEPDVAKKNITDSQEFFNYINNSDSNKGDV